MGAVQGAGACSVAVFDGFGPCTHATAALGIPDGLAESYLTHAEANAGHNATFEKRALGFSPPTQGWSKVLRYFFLARKGIFEPRERSPNIEIATQTLETKGGQRRALRSSAGKGQDDIRSKKGMGQERTKKSTPIISPYVPTGFVIHPDRGLVVLCSASLSDLPVSSKHPADILAVPPPKPAKSQTARVHCFSVLGSTPRSRCAGVSRRQSHA